MPKTFTVADANTRKKSEKKKKKTSNKVLFVPYKQ